MVYCREINSTTSINKMIKTQDVVGKCRLYGELKENDRKKENNRAKVTWD